MAASQAYLPITLTKNPAFTTSDENFSIKITAKNTSSDYTLNLPPNIGSPDQFLKTNGAQSTEWSYITTKSYTTVQKLALTMVETGTLVYDTTLAKLTMWDGVSWIVLGDGLTSEFDAAVFRVFNGTKKVAFDTSPIDVLTTRTISVPNRDVNLNYASLMDQTVATTASPVFVAVNGVTAAECAQLANINATAISAAQWGYLGATDQSVAMAATPTFASVAIKTTGANKATLQTPTLADNYTLTLPSANPSVLSNLQGSSDGLTSWAEDYENASYANLYQYAATYSIVGGADALKTSIIANGGGADPTTPNVYEITDSLTYNGGINLTNVNNIIIRGAVGQRPTLLVTGAINSGFSISYDITHGTTSMVWIGNMDVNTSGADAAIGHHFLIINRQGAAMVGDEVSDVYVKDVFVYNTDYTTSTGVSRSGINALTQISAATRFVDGLYVEDCRFKNLTPRTDRGPIFCIGVNNYIGRRNKVSSPDIATTAYASRGVCRFSGTSGKEYYSYFASGDVQQYNAESSAASFRIVQDQYTYGGYGPAINWELIGCTFANCPSTTQGALRITYSPNEVGGLIPVGQSEVMNVLVKKCKFVSDISGINLEGDNVAVKAGVDLSVKNCYFENNTTPILLNTTYKSNFVGLMIEANDFSVCGLPMTGFTNPEKYDTGVSQGNAIYLRESHIIRTALTDGYNANVALNPVYATPNASAVTRHNYITAANPTGTAAVTDAAVLKFDAAIGAHKALRAAGTVAAPGTVSGFVKVNVNGTIGYIPIYQTGDIA